MPQPISRTDDQLSSEITGFASLSAPQLRERWKAPYGTEPPPRASQDCQRRGVNPFRMYRLVPR